MPGVAIPTWDPQTAFIIGAILVEAILLYVGYGRLEQLVGPRLLELLVGSEHRAGQ